MPSTPPSRPMNRPNSVMLRIGPSTTEPFGCAERKRLPRVLLGLLEAERDAALVGIDLEDLHLDLLAGRDDLAGVHVLLRPAHLRDVDQAFDARLQLHEGAVVGDVRHGALDARADRILGLDRLPRIGLQLLHAERDALRLRVDADDLHLHRVADVEDLGRVVDAAPGHVGDVQQAVDAAQIDEGAVVGDVLDETVDDLALLRGGRRSRCAARRASLRGPSGARRRCCRGGDPS